MSFLRLKGLEIWGFDCTTAESDGYAIHDAVKEIYWTDLIKWIHFTDLSPCILSSLAVVVAQCSEAVKQNAQVWVAWFWHCYLICSWGDWSLVFPCVIFGRHYLWFCLDLVLIVPFVVFRACCCWFAVWFKSSFKYLTWKPSYLILLKKEFVFGHRVAVDLWNQCN